MNAITLNKINHKLQNIPDNFVNDIIAYLDFLSFKANTPDWATSLSEKELELVKRGTDDLKNGRSYKHADAMKKIAAHIKKRHK